MASESQHTLLGSGTRVYDALPSTGYHLVQIILHLVWWIGTRCALAFGGVYHGERCIHDRHMAQVSMRGYVYMQMVCGLTCVRWHSIVGVVCVCGETHGGDVC